MIHVPVRSSRLAALMSQSDQHDGRLMKITINRGSSSFSFIVV